MSAEGFTEAVVLFKKELPAQKMVRVYRGVSLVKDVDLSRQAPYAMRASSDDPWGFAVMEDLRQEVEILAAEPTYENLLAYADKVRPQLNEFHQKRFDENLLKIEDGILEGFSVRTMLNHDQFQHNGGYADTGISPYISASFNPKEAVGYSHYGSNRAALFVIDVPVSRLEDINDDADKETSIKGVLDHKDITAVLFRKGDVSQRAIGTALKTVSDTVQIPVCDANEAEMVLGNQVVANREIDAQQQPIDAEIIRQKRVLKLLSEFPEVGLDIQAIQELALKSGADIYTTTKTQIYDYYFERFRKSGYHIRVPAYSPSDYFDRYKITDPKLLKFRELYFREDDEEKEWIRQHKESGKQ
ncbi:MAG: hypothetical protein MUD10_05225 [Candidatus Pacebacteria bacterium]|nr:hypothetical protein [Candidatus Paceibacterota bacterium]